LREKLWEALKETFQDRLTDRRGWSIQSDEQYVNELIESVREENYWRRELKYPELEWIDGDEIVVFDGLNT